MVVAVLTSARAARWCGLLAMLIGGIVAAQAEVYRLADPNDSVIGTPFYVRADSRQTLLDIGRHHGVGVDEMQQANPNVDLWVPPQDAQVLIPAQRVLPDAPRSGLVLNLAEKRLYFFHSPQEIETFAVGIGREGWETPVGRYRIIERIKNPTWTPPASIRREYAKRGVTLPAVVPAGPENPLGNHALRLSNPSYLIHGTNKPWGVGMPVSSGCTRMFPEDIEHIFDQVAVGTTVTIVDQPYKVGWLGDQLYLEVHGNNEAQVIEDFIRQRIALEGVVIDWEAARKVQSAQEGLPRRIGGRQGSTQWHHLDMIF